MLRESGLPTASKKKLLEHMVGLAPKEMSILIKEEREYLENLSPTLIHDPVIQESAIESERDTAQARLDIIVNNGTDINID